MSEQEKNLATNDRPGAASPSLLQHRILAQTELPALSGAIQRVVQMASSDDETAIPELAHFVLSDLALTQKTLRLANTAIYRANAGGPVSTVSKAIFVLGFELVRTTALAMLLVERLKAAGGQPLHRELHRSLCASVIARELARHTVYKDPEEAAVAALFRNLGRVLVAATEPAVYEEIEAVIARGAATAARASTQRIGCSYDELGQIVLREWEIPEGVVQAVATLPPGAVTPPRSRQQWLGVLATFSMLAGALLPLKGDAETDKAIAALESRFGNALGLDADGIRALLARVEGQAQAVVAGAELDAAGDHHDLAAEAREQEGELADEPEPGPVTPSAGLPMDLLLPEPAAAGVPPPHASGKPQDAQIRLLAGLSDLTGMIAGGGSRTDMLVQVLETLYQGLGFDVAAICLFDARTGVLRARMALGKGGEALVPAFQFMPDGAGNDVFNLALQRDADVVIADLEAGHAQALVPAWYRGLKRPARSLMLLPLVVSGRTLGLFYGERAQAAPEGLLDTEAALVRALKQQLLRSLARVQA